MVNKVVCLLLFGAAYAIEPFLWTYGLYCILKPKRKGIGSYGCFFVSLLLLVLLKQYFVFCGNMVIPAFFFPVLFLYVLLVSNYLFHNTIRIKIMLIVLFYTLSVIVDCIVIWFFTSIFHCHAEILTRFQLQCAFITLIVKGTHFAAYFFLYRIFMYIAEKEIDRKQIVWLFIGNLFLILPFSVGFYVIRKFTSSDRWLRIFCLVQLLAEGVFSFTLYQIYKNKRKMENTIKYYNSIEETTNELRFLRHDFRNHLQLLQYWLKENKVQDSIGYIDTLYETVQQADNVCILDNSVLSIVVTEKKKYAAEQNIILETILTCSRIPIRDIDVNSLISNILDNAIEAASKVEDKKRRKIQFQIGQTEEGVFLECRNGFQSPIIKNRHGRIVTTKKDMGKHGLGLEIIYQIVRRNHGEMTTCHDSEYFSICIFFEVQAAG